MPTMTLPSTQELLQVIPITILSLFACVPVTVKVFRNNQEPSNNFSLSWATLGVFLAAFSFFAFSSQSLLGPAFFGALVFDRLTVFSSLGILLISMLTLCVSFTNVNTRGESFAEHVFLLLLSAVGMLIMICSNDLVVAFIGLELMSIALYVLIGLSHEQETSKEAAFKYFIIGSFASAIFLYGTALIFGTANSTQIKEIAQQAPTLIGSSNVFLIGIAMLMVGIGFKVSMFPFHAWTPDVYQGAPSSVTGFMATGVKLAVFTVFLRFATLNVFSFDGRLMWLLQVGAVLTMLVGNITALAQDNIKRMLAYSSIAHAGYILVGIICAATSKTADAGGATLFYLLGYSFMNVGAFAVVSMIEKENRAHLSIGDYAGLGFKNPILGATFAILLLSLAGIPPTVGFMGKFYLFAAAVKEGFVWLAVLGVINSLLSAYYYLRVLVYMYMKDPIYDVEVQSNFYPGLVITVSTVLTLVMGILSSMFYGAAFSSISSLIGS